MFVMKLLIVISIFHDNLHRCSGILIGYLPGKVYVPSGNLPISFSFVNSCDECICRAIMSTNMSYVAINCLTSSNLCMFYTSYTIDFTIKSNSTAYLYLLQPLPQTALETSTMEMIETTTNGGPCSPPSSGYIAMFTNVPSSYQFYSYLITAQYTGDVNLKFMFQGDSVASWHLDDISLKALNESNTELLIDGDFENYSNSWTLDCWASCGIGSSGFLTMQSCYSGSICFMDGCTGGFDSLYQSINITMGNMYNLSFWLYLDIDASPATRAYVILQ